jgi:hypothetical protein
VLVTNDIDKTILKFNLAFSDLASLHHNTVVYRESCECFMIVVPGGFLSYIKNSFRFRSTYDFTPWTRYHEKFAIVNAFITVRN